MNAGALIRSARQQAGLTQEALARRAGTRQSAVSAYEAGRREPSLATLIRLVRATGFELEGSLVAAAPEPLAATELGRRLLEHRRAIREAVAADGGTNVRVFGSVARGEATADSDLDLLVDLPLRTGILTIGAIARDVERVAGVATDVVPSHALRSEVRERILEEAVAL